MKLFGCERGGEEEWGFHCSTARAVEFTSRISVCMYSLRSNEFSGHHKVFEVFSVVNKCFFLDDAEDNTVNFYDIWNAATTGIWSYAPLPLIASPPPPNRTENQKTMRKQWCLFYAATNWNLAFLSFQKDSANLESNFWLAANGLLRCFHMPMSLCINSWRTAGAPLYLMAIMS